MKRYYLSKIKQVVDPSVGATVTTHRAAEIGGLDMVGGTGDQIAVDPQTGQPTAKAVLVLIGGINHKALQDDPELVPLPAVALDMKVSAIHTATKLAAKSAIKAFGFTDQEIEDIWSNADGMRDVLNAYGRKNVPEFDCNNFDLDES